jgi:hypothetical protein
MHPVLLDVAAAVCPHERVLATVLPTNNNHNSLCVVLTSRAPIQYNTARYDPTAPVNNVGGAATDATASAAATGKKGADKGNNTTKDSKAPSPLKVQQTLHSYY